MKRYLVIPPYYALLIITLLLSTKALAQYEQQNSYTPPLKERILYGGNFSLQLGTYTYIDVSPVVGIWLLPRLAVAAGRTAYIAAGCDKVKWQRNPKFPKLQPTQRKAKHFRAYNIAINTIAKCAKYEIEKPCF